MKWLGFFLTLPHQKKAKQFHDIFDFSLGTMDMLLGLYGYHHLSAWVKEGAIYLKVVRANSRFGLFRSYKVIDRGYRWRTLRTLPIGRKPVFAADGLSKRVTDGHLRN